MKQNILLIICIFFTQALSFADPQNPNIPSLDKVEAIIITNAQQGWSTLFYSDGSVRLSMGPDASDAARVSANSFSHKKIYALLVPHLVDSVEPGDGDELFIFLMEKNNSSVRKYIKDRSVVRKIMQEVLTKMMPTASQHFKELVKKNPPVPPEPTAPALPPQSGPGR